MLVALASFFSRTCSGLFILRRSLPYIDLEGLGPLQLYYRVPTKPGGPLNTEAPPIFKGERTLRYFYDAFLILQLFVHLNKNENAERKWSAFYLFTSVRTAHCDSGQELVNTQPILIAQNSCVFLG